MSEDQFELPEGTTIYYVGLIKKGPTWTPEETPEIEQLQQAHLANNNRLYKEGKLLALGPLLDNGDVRGIDVFRTRSEAEAQAWAATDPMVQAQRLVYELHPWLIGKDSIADQRQMAADLFNQTWELIDKPDRSTDDDLEMIHLAHASRALWKKVGTEVNFVRGEWLIAHVYAIVNRSEPALVHARKCLEICEANHFGDWDLAFAYEALARALACAGDRSGAQENYRLAEQAGKQIAEQDDREHFEKSIEQAPWFGIKFG